MLLGWLAALPAIAGEVADEDSVKVAFLYNFAKFVAWPTGGGAHGAPLVFCVSRGSLNAAALASLEGKTVQNRPVRVDVVESGSPPSFCDVAFVKGPPAPGPAPAAQVLLVSDFPGFAEAGGHIGLFEKEGRIRFKINIGAMRDAGLDMSSKLLQLATVVLGG